MLNRTAFYLGMTTCEKGGQAAVDSFNRLVKNEIDSVLYFSSSDANPMTSDTFDSLMRVKLKFVVVRPEAQPILECYMDKLDSMARQYYGNEYRMRIEEEVDEIIKNRNEN
ncbi:MAG: hypothetical protein ABJH05_01720 [Fulvivirga sp.]